MDDTKFCHQLIITLPWVPEVFLGNFRCWPKAEATSGEARVTQPRPQGASKAREKRPGDEVAGHYKDLIETGNRARKVSGTKGIKTLTKFVIYKVLF